MRIVGGSHRGRALTPPAGRETRPTLDRVREALFSILSHASRWYEDDFHPLFDGVILDAYAGSGALGLEAISRGASKAVLFDTDRGALAVIEENITNLKLGDQARVQRADATKPPRASAPASMVFLDPPYGLTYDHLCKAGRHISLLQKPVICGSVLTLNDMVKRNETLAPNSTGR